MDQEKVIQNIFKMETPVLLRS